MVRNEWGNAQGNTVAFGPGEYFEYNGNRIQAIPQTGSYHVARRAVKLTSVRQSSDKLLLVENFNQNLAGNGSGAQLDRSLDAIPNFAFPAHPSKKNNFLFVDGHVQSMRFEETYPTTSSPTARPAQGMWKISQ